ncbi:hypothetical protein AALO_G00031200 [Alosa alosa]|uniref:Uncharacterized protein n=1 Tax=Alosa alosa TaxID=278164 RepID=A0AAV6HC81_9TELE|nr:hypothetical protein AALO_G00031200 [Alosa alosa]
MERNVVVMQQQQQPLLVVGSNEWTTGICDCCDDMGICCYATFCFPCFTCQTTGELNECCALPFCCDAGLVPPISLALRYGIRKQYGIQGSLLDDCLYATYCNMCSWCQIAREIKIRKQSVTVVSTQPTFIQTPANYPGQRAM